jgi:signal peptidase II
MSVSHEVKWLQNCLPEGHLILKKILRDYGLLFLVSTTIVVLDQWSKYWVRSQLEYGEAWAPWDWLLPYARLIHAQNTGAAFGMLQGMNAVFTVLAIVVSCVIIYYFPRVPREDWLLRLALALQLGGAVGNLVDRVTEGYVTDFISVGQFPVLNIADASISIGVALLILAMWLKERGQTSHQTPPGSEPAEMKKPEEIKSE